MSETQMDLMVPEASAVPAYALDKSNALEAWGDMLAGMPSGAPPRIKLNGKQFCLIDSSGEEKPFPMAKMIAGADDNLYMPMLLLKARSKIQKSWYAKAFNPNDEEHASPDCFSNDGERPDPTALGKQCDTCADCPHNAFGSGKDQNGMATDGKACRDIKTFAAYIPNFGVYSFRIPPASFKNWARLGKQLANVGIKPHLVKYLVGFEPTASYPILTFLYGGAVPENSVAKLEEMAASQEVTDIINNRITAGNAASAARPTPPPPVAVAEVVDDLGLDGDLGLAGTQNAAPPVKPAPQPAQAASEPVDKSGNPHDPDYHASTKTKTADGYWKIKPGLSDDARAEAMALREVGGNGPATAPAPTPAPAPGKPMLSAEDAVLDDDAALALSLGL